MRIAELWPLVLIIFLTYCCYLNNKDSQAENKFKAGLWWVGVFILIAFIEGLVTTKESHQVVNTFFGIYVCCAAIVFLEFIYKRWFKKKEGL